MSDSPDIFLQAVKAGLELPLLPRSFPSAAKLRAADQGDAAAKAQVHAAGRAVIKAVREETAAVDAIVSLLPVDETGDAPMTETMEQSEISTALRNVLQLTRVWRAQVTTTVPPSSYPAATPGGASLNAVDPDLIVAVFRLDNAAALDSVDLQGLVQQAKKKLEATWSLFNDSSNPRSGELRIHLTGRIGKSTASFVTKEGRLQHEYWEDDLNLFASASRIVLMDGGAWGLPAQSLRESRPALWAHLVCFLLTLLLNAQCSQSTSFVERPPTSFGFTAMKLSPATR